MLALPEDFKQPIKQFFRPDGYIFAASGILFKFPDGDIRLWARLDGVLQDGGAHTNTCGISGVMELANFVYLARICLQLNHRWHQHVSLQLYRSYPRNLQKNKRSKFSSAGSRLGTCTIYSTATKPLLNIPQTCPAA